MKRLLQVFRNVGLVLGGLLIVAGFGLLAVTLKAGAKQSQRFESQRLTLPRSAWTGQRT